MVKKEGIYILKITYKKLRRPKTYRFTN